MKLFLSHNIATLLSIPCDVHLLVCNYRKQGKIRWAKLSRSLQFSRVPLKFLREYLYKFHIMALFKFFKCKAPQKFPVNNFIGGNLQKFSPANLSPFTVYQTLGYAFLFICSPVMYDHCVFLIYTKSMCTA